MLRPFGELLVKFDKDLYAGNSIDKARADLIESLDREIAEFAAVHDIIGRMDSVFSERVPSSHLSVLDRKRGVYFLMDGLAVVYIGKTANIHSRCLQHKIWARFFDAVCYIEVGASISLDVLEKALIRKYEPKLNRLHRLTAIEPQERAGPRDQDPDQHI